MTSVSHTVSAVVQSKSPVTPTGPPVLMVLPGDMSSRPDGAVCMTERSSQQVKGQGSVLGLATQKGNLLKRILQTRGLAPKGAHVTTRKIKQSPGPKAGFYTRRHIQPLILRSTHALLLCARCRRKCCLPCRHGHPQSQTPASFAGVPALVPTCLVCPVTAQECIPAPCPHRSRCC